ncbi:MAG: hypothetical protein LUD46_21115 [Parabacteroides sp.]|nr:hypothetical protein [Parabacteroides sp.]
MKHRINIPWDGHLLSAACLSVLLAVGGCESGESLPASADPVEVSLFTKGITGSNESALSYRLLVFNEQKCINNISFVPGSSSVSLAAGTYSFAALSVPEGLNLPAAADTPDEITPDWLLGFGSKPVREFRIGAPTEVKVGDASTAYTATLESATAVVSLNLSNLPSDKEVKFKLSNMYTLVKLSDLTYSGETAYPLNLDGETVCFPCKGDVELTYTVDGGESKTIYTGSSLKAGSRLSVLLGWSEDAHTFLLLSSTVTDWVPGNGSAQEGSALNN